MDYSLLVGIHDRDKADQEVLEKPVEEADENGFTESEEDCCGGEPGCGPGECMDGVPTPPDSPMARLNAPDFSGEFDDSFERFAMKCSPGN